VAQAVIEDLPGKLDPVGAALGAAVVRPAPFSRALTTRFLDFWLLGGASLLVWLAMFIAQHFRYEWAVDQHFKNLTVTTVSLTLFINNPHFLVSYKLAYGRGRAFVTSYWWQLDRGAAPARGGLRLCLPEFHQADGRRAAVPARNRPHHWHVGRRHESAQHAPARRLRVHGGLQPDVLHGGMALHQAGVRLHDALRQFRRLPAHAGTASAPEVEPARHLVGELQLRQPARRKAHVLGTSPTIRSTCRI
jgi:hypothetical protein